MAQVVAMEGACFGIVSSHVVSEEGAKTMKMLGCPWFTFPGGGFSTVRSVASHRETAAK